MALLKSCQYLWWHGMGWREIYECIVYLSSVHMEARSIVWHGYLNTIWLGYGFSPFSCMQLYLLTLLLTIFSTDIVIHYDTFIHALYTTPMLTLLTSICKKLSLKRKAGSSGWYGELISVTCIEIIHTIRTSHYTVVNSGLLYMTWEYIQEIVVLRIIITKWWSSRNMKAIPHCGWYYNQHVNTDYKYGEYVMMNS